MLVLIDARGHGNSDKPHHKVDYHWQLRASDILSVADDLGHERFHFWGYSMGGIYGFKLAVCAPDRLISLIIGGAHPYATSFKAFDGIDGSDGEAFISAMETMLDEIFSPESCKRMLNNDTSALVAAADDRSSLVDPVSSLNLPCLLYVGENDSRYAQVKQFACDMKSAVFASIPAQNHAGTNARSDLVLPQAIDFLNNLGKV